MAELTDQARRTATSRMSPLVIAFVPMGIALNLAIGTVVHVLKLPVYLDAIGTIVTSVLLGWRAGMITGIGSFLLGGVLTNPVLPWFCGTQAVIALYSHFVAKKAGFKSYKSVLISGIGLGVVAAIASAPVIVYLFGGVTGSGPSLVVAFLLSTGHTLLKSVFISGLASEPLDKTLQCLLAFWIIRGLPPRLLRRFVERGAQT